MPGYSINRWGESCGVTVKDIATRAKVSTATVSNVLTRKKYVSAELVRRVNDAIEGLGYRPNNYARGLKTNRSHTIGMQIPDIANPYFGNAVKVVQAEAASRGYQIILYNAENVIDTERQNIEGMLDAHVDGIVYVAPRLAVQSILDTVQVPVVVVDRLPIETDRNVAFVYSDNYGGAASIADYMLDKGYERFFCLSGPVDLVANASERLRGFTEELARRGVSKERCPIYYGEFTFECGHDMMADVLTNYKPEEGRAAAFVGSDIMAWGAMEALKARKMKIPQEMAIVGYDNIYFSNFLYPTLTTVENPIQKMSREAADLLLDELEHGKGLGGISVMLNATLIERSSC